MNLNQLEYFCTAARYQSITQAAKKLFVTQPAVSGAIRELEKEFSVNLFTHARNKLALTEEGQRFYERAEQLLRDVETAKQQLSDLGKTRAPVLVGIPPLWGTTFFPDLLQDFQKRYPDIRLTFYEYGSARAANLVQEEELDVALVSLGLSDLEKFNSVRIGKDRFVIAVDPQHPLADRTSVKLEEIIPYPIIMFNTDSVQNVVFRNRFERMGVAPNILLYTSQIHTMKSLVHTKSCVAFFYETLLQDHTDMVGIPLSPSVEKEVGLIWRKGKYTTASTEAFINFVRDYPLFPEEF